MAKKKRPEKTESGYYRQGTRTMNDGTTGYNRPVRTVKGVLAGAAKVDEAVANRQRRDNTVAPKSATGYVPTAKEAAQAAKERLKSYGDFKDMTPGVYTPKEKTPVENKAYSMKRGGPVTALDKVQQMYSKKKR
jgi:hypothetical protein